MAKYHVCCLLPNASGNINGIDFVADEPSGSMITEFPIEAEQALGFRGIGGFVVVEVSAEDEAALIAAVKAAEQARGNASRAASAAAAQARAAAAEAAAPAPQPEIIPQALAATAAAITADNAAGAGGASMGVGAGAPPAPDPAEAERERAAILANRIEPAPTPQAEAAGQGSLVAELTQAVDGVVASGGDPIVKLDEPTALHAEAAAGAAPGDKELF
jgi:hypothetical protein